MFDLYFEDCVQNILQLENPNFRHLQDVEKLQAECVFCALESRYSEKTQSSALIRFRGIQSVYPCISPSFPHPMYLANQHLW